MKNGYLTITQTAKELGTTRQAVYELIKLWGWKGKCKKEPYSGIWLIPKKLVQQRKKRLDSHKV